MTNELLSIEALENDYWKPVDFPTTLIEKCYSYRKIPLSQLTVEQLRLLIGQQIGLHYTIPKAILILEKNILAEGDLYPGDLLNSMLDLPEEIWKRNEGLMAKFKAVLHQNLLNNELTSNKKLIEKVKELV